MFSLSLSLSSIKTQKYLIVSYIVSINCILSYFITIYNTYWYIFICLLALSTSVNSINVLLLLGNTITNTNNTTQNTTNNTNNTNNNNNDNNTKSQYIDYDIENKNSINKIYKTYNTTINYRKVVYVLTCYNETEQELRNTLNSIHTQTYNPLFNKFIIIICDGKLNTTSNPGTLRTDEILINIILKDNLIYNTTFIDAYKTWFNNWENIDIYTGIYNNIPLLLIVKHNNIGKRDSLTLVRRLIYYYNIINNDTNSTTSTTTTTTSNRDTQNTSKIINNEFKFIDYYLYCSPDLLHFIDSYFTIRINSKFNVNVIDNVNINIDLDTFGISILHNKDPIHFIIGTDADTILSPQCSYELINTYDNSSGKMGLLVGVVGIVDIVKNWYNPLVMYQYCEYLYAQFLKRKTQSVITNKVNCLSGCVQLLKVCNETCGNQILNLFNKLPSQTDDNDNIIHHIRSYASEDRNHICLMFQLYPYVKTIQATNAIAYTQVPNTLTHFLRQRKRWCAGAMVNDLLLIVNKCHNKWERFMAIVNVVIFSINIFVFVATIEFIMAVIYGPTLLMLLLSIIMILPLLYSLSIPLLIYNDGITRIEKTYNILYYYLGVLNYYTMGFIYSLLVYCYTLYYLDDFNWNRISIIDKKNDNKTSSIVILKNDNLFIDVIEPDNLKNDDKNNNSNNNNNDNDNNDNNNNNNNNNDYIITNNLKDEYITLEYDNNIY